MSRLMVIAAIAISYYVFAILLNSVGTVILQSINSFDISKPQASTLEGFKDLSIAIVSFFVASVIPRVGYKLSMLVGLALVAVACAATPAISSFWFIKVLFACIGTAFALVKVSIYAIIGQLSSSTKAHSSLMNTVEGIFMLGVLSGYWVFAWFIDPNNDASLSWLNVYYLLAALVGFTFIIVMLAPIHPVNVEHSKGIAQEFFSMLKLAYQPLVLVLFFGIPVRVNRAGYRLLAAHVQQRSTGSTHASQYSNYQYFCYCLSCWTSNRRRCTYPYELVSILKYMLSGYGCCNVAESPIG
ncbi:hypothetical protein KUL42_22370 [Alteromonas sp. KUL42]|nr:hypothetical protein KUL42_22370 [Alteromonas sp. KUL42]